MSRDAKICVSTGLPDLALVLAGGLGTRLRAVLSDRPKSLAPAAGRPFLYYVLDYLRRQGMRRIVLCVGFLASQVAEYARQGQEWGLEIAYSIEQSALGTGGALRQASSNLDEPFFALNGDTLFQVDLSALWKQHLGVGGLATVALLRIADGSAAGERSARGCVRLAADGHILDFNEKQETQNFPSQNQTQNFMSQNQTQNFASLLVNGGVYVLEPQALAEIQPAQAASIEREVFPRLAARGQLAGLEQSAYFADIGTPHSLSTFEHDVLEGKLNLA